MSRQLQAGQHGNNFQQGFSLLEIMVVMLLIALTTSIVVLSFRHDVSQAVEYEASRFAALVGQMCEESVVQGKIIAVTSEGPSSYLFTELTAEGWAAIGDDDLLRERRLPDDITIRLQLPAATSAGAQIYLPCAPDGILPVFTALFSMDDLQFRVSSTETQSIDVEQLRTN